MKSISPVSNRELFTLMDAMFGTRSGDSNRVPQLSLPIDAFERDGNLTVRALMPGVAPENVEINVEDNILTLSGENQTSQENSDGDVRVYRRENVYGQFKRSIRLSEDFDAAKAQASFANGVVTVTIPRAETAKPKVFRIPVTTMSEPTSQAMLNASSENEASHNQEAQ